MNKYPPILMGVALNPTCQTHYIDHLGPIAAITNSDYCFLDTECYELGMKYYPDLKGYYIDFPNFSLESMIEKYDISYMSDLWDDKLRNLFNTLTDKHNKIWHNVHCPHGFSDKGYYLSKCYQEDVVLIYGENMINQLRTYGVWEEMNQYIMSGNYRYTYYKKHRDFYEKIYQHEIQSQFDQEKPIILYAPSWVDVEGLGSFFDAYHYILDSVPDKYNLIVKLHPLLEYNDVTNYHRIIGQYEDRKNILFLTSFPPVYPILAHTDIYIGDMSSIGYDYLIFDKPLFLLNCQNRDPKTDMNLLLFQCGTEIKPHQYENIYQIIEEALPTDAEKYSSLRKQMWSYTFGDQERPFSEINQEIIQACF